MALEIFKLFGSVFVDTEKAEESLQKTDKKAEGLGSKLLKGVGTAAKFGTAIVGAAGVAATGMGALLGKTLETTAQIKKFSDQAGVSTTEYQKLDQVFKQSGWSMEQAAGDFSALNEKMLDSLEGSGESYEMFEKLGVSVTDASGNLRDTGSVFNDTILALQNMGNETERNATASILLGTSGEELASVLNMTNEEFLKMKESANVIDEDKIAKATEFKNQWEGLKTTFSNALTTIGVEMMPILQSLMDWVSMNMPMIQTVFTNVFGVVSGIVQTFSQVVQTILTTISTKLGESGITFDTVFATIKTVFETAWNGLKSIWETIGKPIFDFITKIVGTLAGYFKEKMPAIAGFFKTMVSDIKTMWDNNLKPMFTAIGDFLNKVLAPAFKFVFNNIIAPVVDAAFKLIKDLWENTLKPVFTGITDFISGVFTLNFEKAFKGLISIVDGIFGGLVSIVKTPINAVIGIINNFIGGLNKLKIPDWIPVVGGKGINIPKIPLLAEGGTIYKKGSAIVGEEGAELLEMPAGARVTPLTNAQKNRVNQESKEIKLEVNLNIDNFNNNSNADIDTLVDEISFKIKKKLEGGGVLAPNFV